MKEETGSEVAKTQTSGQLATALDADQIKEFRKKMESFTRTLHQTPKPEKILTHEYEGFQYLPISAIEKDLDKVYFGLVQYEILKFTHVLNEVVVEARIKVFHPVINQWMNYDGIGSAILQQDAKTKVMDFMIYKKGNAMQLAAPRAYAEAIKNAAKKIGKRFGADLNRKHEDYYIPNLKQEDDNNKALN